MFLLVRTLVFLTMLSLTGFSAVAAEIIIESIEDGENFQWFSTEGGKWNVSTSKSKAEGLRGTKSKYDDANETVGAARFKPELPAAGKYEVFVTYPQSGNASGVIHKVHSAEGDKETALDQNGRLRGADPPADTWVSLGTFRFNKGADGFVEIRDPGTGVKPNDKEPNARVYADAVKFVPADGAPAASSKTAPPAEIASLPASSPAPSMPSLPATGTGATGAAEMPSLPTIPGNSTPAASFEMPSLPTASSASAPSPAGSLPSLPLPAAPGSTDMPTLPPATSSAASGFPSLPTAGSSAAPSDPGLPSLPTAGSSTAPPALISGAARELASAPGLPGLPSFPETASSGGPQPTPTGGAMSNAANVVVDNSGLQWIHDIGHARNIARDGNKHMLVFFVAPGNRQVAKYENEFFMSPSVRPLLDQLVLVRIDFTQNTKVAYGLGIYGAGTLALVDPKGLKVLSIEQIPATAEDLGRRLTEKK